MNIEEEKYRGKKILFGISGGISAYKSCELIRYFVSHRAEVRVIMTKSAQQFISPLTVETLSNQKVTTSIWPHDDHYYPEMAGTHHIDIAHWPDVFLIAPATANTISKIAQGIADDVLSTIVMATPVPVVIAPAMNDVMYQNTFVQDNLEKLKKANYRLIDPDSGFLACGYEGVGRLASLERIQWEVEKVLIGDKTLENRNVMITAGPTVEEIDEVRYISNYSSGKMGYALARQARLMGANVTLISGPTELTQPHEVNCVQVKTAEEMLAAVMKAVDKQDIFIGAAAVADFRPKAKVEGKMKKDKFKGTVLEIEKTPDILASIKDKKICRVGFALELDNELEYAREKIEKKKLDMIVINNPTEAGAGFNTDTNKIAILDKNNQITRHQLMSKASAAKKILEKVSELFN